MRACGSCSAPVAEASRFCPSCGSAVAVADPSLAPTLVSGDPAASGIGPSGAGRRSRFVAGELVNGRYRIEGMLGRGAMGEVYRAEDVRLGQVVALKFLPVQLAQNPSMLARFHNEVRLARQVTHGNVCRVHDIGEVDGQPFLSMEYVDGENLASLLRRIGRLPADKAVEIARQLCAGLAAAHDRGVLHRDLKPENVMIDGEGTVRIMDFGLAGLTREISAEDSRSGTPAYMAPEQLEGREITVRSDLYALGLVLHEMFTGRRVFDAVSLEELRAKRRDFVPRPVSDSVPGLDASIDRTVLRCLEEDPIRRPASALAVARSLTGVDLLTEALAAGEMPSPEMVAAAGSRRGLAPAKAWMAAAGVVVAIAATAYLRNASSLLAHGVLDRPPLAMVERAREILERAGHGAAARDAAWGYGTSREPLEWILANDTGAGRWKRLDTGRYGAATFWYRQSPKEMVPRNLLGAVTQNDPIPWGVSGNATVQLDEKGRLLSLVAVPDQVVPEGPSREVDWKGLFAAAGLDLERFAPAESSWTPPTFADTVLAWTGVLPEQPDVTVRVEAASFHGTPVRFEVVPPWARPARQQPIEPTRLQRLQANVNVLLLLAGIVGGGWAARWNVREGRADRIGAYRLAAFMFVASMVRWVLRADHVGSLGDEWGMFVYGSSFSLFIAALGWLAYLGLEPLVRRHWPSTLVGWSRLLSGRVADPAVAREVLLGLACGAALWTIGTSSWWLLTAIGRDPMPLLPALENIRSFQTFAGALAGNMTGALISPMLLLLLLAALRHWLKHPVAATAVFALILGPLFAGEAVNQGMPALLAVGLAIVNVAIFVIVLGRLGLLALVSSVMVPAVSAIAPPLTGASSWIFPYAATTVLLFAGLAFWAARTAIGDAPPRRVEAKVGR